MFDPFPGPGRRSFSVYRRSDNGGLPPVLVTADDSVYSKVLGCHLRKVGADATTRLRLATGGEGAPLVPTAEEAARAAKETALRRVAELEAELKRRR